MKAKGFTLIELLLVMGLVGILAALSSINLVQPNTRSRLDSATSVLLSDIKQQQIKAMSGYSGATSSAQMFGVKFDSNNYVLFSGNSYSSDSLDNFIVPLDQNLTFVIDLPEEQLLFNRLSGEVFNFDNTASQVVLQDQVSNQQKILSINRMGVLSIE